MNPTGRKFRSADDVLEAYIPGYRRPEAPTRIFAEIEDRDQRAAKDLVAELLANLKAKLGVRSDSARSGSTR